MYSRGRCGKRAFEFFPTFPKGFITSEPAETPVYAVWLWQLPILDDSKAPYPALWSQCEALTRYQFTGFFGDGAASGRRPIMKAAASSS